ncbi:hypothetical protein BV511_13195 [Methylorubrum extorquens]|uniref:hypothetical protein n=1 Tax=Methylorubrum extorquens TaxID=408 RepID=UPI000972AA38|nr:hypothetical protein [Methylorubrum extorquens]APX85586.1 hypothetical protein BV511_13195 [Methylorubrum extorquens]
MVFNLVMVALGIAEADLTRAAVWLGEAIGYDFAPKMVLNWNRPKLLRRDGAARLYRMAQEAGEPAPALVHAIEPATPVTDIPSAPMVPDDRAPPAENVPRHMGGEQIMSARRCGSAARVRLDRPLPYGGRGRVNAAEQTRKNSRGRPATGRGRGSLFDRTNFGENEQTRMT